MNLYTYSQLHRFASLLYEAIPASGTSRAALDATIVKAGQPFPNPDIYHMLDLIGADLSDPARALRGTLPAMPWYVVKARLIERGLILDAPGRAGLDARVSPQRAAPERIPSLHEVILTKDQIAVLERDDAVVSEEDAAKMIDKPLEIGR